MIYDHNIDMKITLTNSMQIKYRLKSLLIE